MSFQLNLDKNNGSQLPLNQQHAAQYHPKNENNIDANNKTKGLNSNNNSKNNINENESTQEKVTELPPIPSYVKNALLAAGIFTLICLLGIFHPIIAGFIVLPFILLSIVILIDQISILFDTATRTWTTAIAVKDENGNNIPKNEIF